MGLQKTEPKICLVSFDDRLKPLAAELQASELFQISEFRSLKNLRSSRADLVLLNLADFGREEGLETLELSRSRWPNASIVVFVVQRNAAPESDYLKRGSRSVIDLDEVKGKDLLALLKKTVFRKVIHRSNVRARTLEQGEDFAGILTEQMGESAVISNLIKEIELIAKTDFRVLIVGETGTGKELIAKTIHDLSARANNPFKALDCGAIPESLFESLLFGHEKGAFTGAQKSGAGFFRAAEKGTLFLDEISSMDFASQSTLLRALEEKKYYRIGSNQALSAEFRIVSAANKNLAPSEASETFRSDLYFRLAEYVLTVPPLRERVEDIPHLVRRFTRLSSAELKIHELSVSDDALERLCAWTWPGNARELRNVMRRATLLAGLRDRSTEIDKIHILPLGNSEPELAPRKSSQTLNLPTLRETDTWKSLMKENRKRYEEKLLTFLYADCEGNVAEIARRLKADYKSIHNKIKEYKLGN